MIRLRAVSLGVYSGKGCTDSTELPPARVITEVNPALVRHLYIKLGIELNLRNAYQHGSTSAMKVIWQRTHTERILLKAMVT
jgi:hypothetical protein